MTDPLALGATPLPVCPGRTWFDTLVENWHDQGMMRRHMEGLHELDLERAQQRPVYALTVPTAAGPLRFTADPEDRTLTFHVNHPHPSSYEPAPWMPGTDWSETMALPPAETTLELEAVPGDKPRDANGRFTKKNEDFLP
jgi:hypothetical protein